MNATIEDNFKEIELLNRNVLSIIYQIDNNHDISKRLTLVSECLVLFKSFGDLLTINKFKISQLFTPSVDQVYDLERYTVILSDLRIKLRSAQLESKRQEDVFDKEQTNEYLKNVFVLEQETQEVDSERAALFKYNDENITSKPKSEWEVLVDKNKEVSTRFLRARQLLETSAFNSDMVLENFEESTRKLDQMNSSFDLMNGMLDVAKSLVHSLNQLGAKQRTQVKYSLYFFVGCCCFVILRRTLGMASKIYWLLTLPIRVIIIPFRILFTLLRLFMGSNARVERAEDIIGITEEFLLTTSIDTIIASATSSIISVITATTTLESYEELSKLLSSIINGDVDEILTTTVSDTIVRLVDEL